MSEESVCVGVYKGFKAGLNGGKKGGWWGKVFLDFCIMTLWLDVYRSLVSLQTKL
jgi:hypothetical protein